MKFKSIGTGFFSMLILFACTGSQIQREITPVVLSGGSETMLSPQELFDAMAIEVVDEKVQFVLGDNIAGYIETYTYGYKKGEGYKMDSSALFHDFGTYAGGEVLDRTEAEMEILLPYGWKTVYDESTYDEFVMLSGEYAVAVSVHSDEAKKLSVVPILNFMIDKADVKESGGVVLISFKNELDAEYPTYAAISSDVLFDFKSAKANKYPEMKSTFKIKANMLKPLFTSSEEVNDMTLYIAFGFTAEEAIEKANRLADENAVMLEKQKVYDRLTESYLWTDDDDYNSALMWSKVAGYTMVSEEYGKGIWAGLPWFKDNWGRDTFIALPGILLVTGHFDDAKDVINNFGDFQNQGNLSITVSYDSNDDRDIAREWFKDQFDSSISYKSGNMYPSVDSYYITHIDELETLITGFTNGEDTAGLSVEISVETNEDFGRVPNRVTGDAMIYNTTDGTPWFMREVMDYLRYTGDEEYATEIYPVIKRAMAGALENYVDESGFLTHDDADTWMDARINGAEPWSARGSMANDIQALWYTAVLSAVEIANYNGDTETAEEWQAIADQLKANFQDLFWNSSTSTLADRIREDGTADYKIRPNQLMVISVPFENQLLTDKIEANVVKNAVSSLLYPYGIASLNQEHPYFHPYHENWDYYNKDAAYHNGTVWGWNAGFTISAMTKYGMTELAYELTENLTHQILYQGCRGSMSEVMDALQEDKEDLVLTGTYSQAWSVSEFCRNGYQDYAGFRPNLLEKEIDFVPAIPEKWNSFEAKFAFAEEASFSESFERLNDGSHQFTLSYSGYSHDLTVSFEMLKSDWSRVAFSFELSEGTEVVLLYDPSSGTATLDGVSQTSTASQNSFASWLKFLDFAEPDFDRDYEMLFGENMLEKIIKNDLFDEEIDDYHDVIDLSID